MHMKKLLNLTLMLVCTMIGYNASAHALWIATKSSATINQAHPIRIYYGEYAAQEIEPINKWYSDVKDFTLWLTTPSQQKVKLEKQAATDFFQSSFTPTEEGTYTLTVVHPTKDLGGTTKFEFSSVSFITVGNSVASTAVDDVPLYVQIQPQPYEKGQQVDAAVYQNSKPLADAEVIVMSEEGWSKAFKTDTAGHVSFPVLWSGNYVVEASHSIEETGVWHDKPYQRTWRGATTFIQVD